jgi:hypothetical protein
MVVPGMAVEQELRDMVERYVSGRAGVDALRDWLAHHAQILAKIEDVRAAELDGLVVRHCGFDGRSGSGRVHQIHGGRVLAWLLLSEYGLGHRTEEEVRRELRHALLPAGVS